MEKQKSNISVFFALAACIATLGCSSKPKPASIKEPQAPALSASEPSRGGGNQDEEARRQRMLQRAKEVFQPIYFPYDQAILDANSRSILGNVRAFLMDYPEVSVTVEGHADERGTTDYNLALGGQRANSISIYLESLGVPKSNLRTVSYGEERPAREGHSEQDWGLNRRAEFQPGY